MSPHIMTKHLNHSNYNDLRYEASSYLLTHLLEARNKLKSTVDYVVQSTIDLLNIKTNYSYNQNIPLTLNQYKAIIAAENILEKCQFVFPSAKYTLPNTNVLINNVSVHSGNNKDKSVVISEAAVLELLELYEQMGVTIQKLVEATNKSPVKKSVSLIPERIINDENKTSTEELTDDMNNPNLRSTLSAILAESEVTDEDKSIKAELADANTPSNMRSTLSSILSKSNVTVGKNLVNPESTDDDVTTPEVESSLSALLKIPSRNLNNKTIPKDVPDETDDKPCVYIKIKCVSDISDVESNTRVDSMCDCAKDCSSRYHLKLDGNPLTLKVNQSNVAEGTVYCINTDEESDSNEIKIIIKQCPDCKSTVVSSTTGIVSDMGESHESITLHGKQGDEEEMSYSDDSVKDKCRCELSGISCTKLTKDPCREFTVPCTCKAKMDVVIDSDSLDKSEVTIKGRDKLKTTVKEEDVVIDSDSLDKSEVTIKGRDKLKTTVKDKIIEEEEERKETILLTRKRLCSSMEFDVSTVHSRLREEQLEHKNGEIVIELNNLGVNKILRACRPAKCCRKAILNEKQRTALPYCVSLKSLPLMKNDLEVIKQSIDMSEKKLKTAVDVSQIEKSTLAYYVSLGENDFKPGSNIQWVVPVYDIKFRLNQTNGMFFTSKSNNETNKKSDLIRFKLSKPEEEDKDADKSADKCFVLVKRSSSQIFHIKKSESTQKDNVQYKLACAFDKILSPTHFKLTKNEDIWNDFKYNGCGKKIEHFQTNHYKEFRQFEYGQVAQFSAFCHKFTNLTNSTLPEEDELLTCHKKASLTKKLESGDFSIPSLTAIIDKYINELKIKKKKNKSKKIPQNNLYQRRNLTNIKSMPVFSNRLFEGIEYKSKSLRIVFRQTRSLEFVRIKNNLNCMETTEMALQCPYFVSNLHEKSKCVPKKAMKTESLKKFVNEYKHGNNFNAKTIQCYQFLDCSKPVDPHSQKKKKKKKEKNLEYYVSLVNGDLVWGNTLPLKPQKYNTFYNHSNRVLNKDSTSIKNSVVSNPVNNQNYRQKADNTINKNKNTILKAQSKDKQKDKYSNPVKVIQPTPTIQDREKHDILPKSNTPNTMTNLQKSVTPQMMMVSSLSQLGPESTVASWAPCVVSDISLPKVQEKNANKQKLSTVDASTKKTAFHKSSKKRIEDSKIKFSTKKGHTEQAQEGFGRAEYVSEVKAPALYRRTENTRKAHAPEVYASSGYASDGHREKNARKDCCAHEKPIQKKQVPAVYAHQREAHKENSRKVNAAEVYSRESKGERQKGQESVKKKWKPGDIKIAIQKLTENETLIQEQPKRTRNKEICEIYKNHNMTSEKSVDIMKERKNRRDQTLTFRANENLNIYIQDQKIRLNTKERI